LALGWPSVGWGLARISSRELSEWQAFARIDPFNQQRADLRAGIVSSVIANVHRDAKKRPEPYGPGDFLPKFQENGSERVKQSPEAMLGLVEVMNRAFGGVDLREKAPPAPQRGE